MSTIEPAKPSFYDICINHNFNSQKLQEIATTSGVPMSTIEAMCNGATVARSDAEKVLAAFSHFTHRTWTLNTVHILIHPTFADLYELHRFDTAILSKRAGIPIAIVDQMVCNYPVSKEAALVVLQTLSNLLGQSYTLENVAVKLSDGRNSND